ncbi:MAG: N-formylglutamate amidohydrolase [Anaerolineae bacterium]|nr:N-formylglutamate amidohydrolase [Anaerolineae bacterium]MDQ7034798.1 N-formylglutamate amidohydrolase [Anaerolineae bacterium]
MTDRLPIAIVIPHGGLTIPSELTERIALTEEQIFNEADVYTDLIYEYRDYVLHWHSFLYSRAIIDVNRPSDDKLHFRSGDGAVKRITSYGATVFAPDKEPDAELERELIEKYWQTWHDQLAKIAADDQVKLVLDCHSMAALGPSNYGDPSQVRPRVTASNIGDAEGNPRSDKMQITASPQLTRLAAEKLGEALADIPELAPTAEYGINAPFWGGWNIHLHGGKVQPWLMIEVSRAMYIGEQTGDSPVVLPDETRIALLRERIWQAIEAIVATL